MKREKLKIEKMILDFISGEESYKQAYIRFESNGEYLGAIDNTKKPSLLKLKKWVDLIVDANKGKSLK